MPLDVQEVCWTCQHCNGSGETEYSREDILRLINGMSLGIAKLFIKEWKEHDEKALSCIDCGGQGKGISFR